MTKQMKLGGAFTFPGTSMSLYRMGYGAMQLAGPGVGGLAEPSEGSIEEPLTVLAELKSQGLIAHIGLSNVTPGQLAEAQKITEIVCIQNFYNVAHRNDDAFIDDLAQQGIAYVPFFPLGGFTPIQSSGVDRIAAAMQATPMQVALAWLLQRSANILLIPGTSSSQHLRENLDAAGCHHRTQRDRQRCRGGSANVVIFARRIDHGFSPCAFCWNNEKLPTS